MKKFFQLIDIYGTKFSFRMHDQDNFKTPLGGIFSIITVSIIFIFTFFFGHDFYFGSNPIIYTNTIIPEKYDPPLSLSPENFVIAWRIENYQKVAVNYTGLIYPVTFHFRLNRDENGNMILYSNNILPNVKCNQNNAKVKEFENFLKSNDWFCYDWTKGNYTFGGFFDGDYVDAFQTVLYVCEDGIPFSPTEKRCANLQDYQKFETDNMALQISVLYPQFYFAADDLKSPLRLTYKNYYYYFNLKTTKIDRLFFNKITIKDDKGWIFEDISKHSLISFNRIQGDQNLNEIKNGTSSQFYEFNIYMEKSSQVINRSYMKIQDLSAKVGGLIKIIMIFFQTLNFLISYHDFQTSIFSELFTYPQADFEKICKNQRKTSSTLKIKTKIDDDLKQASFVELKNQKSKLNNREMSSFNNFFPNPNSPDNNSDPKFNNFIAEMNVKIQLQSKNNPQSSKVKNFFEKSNEKNNVKFNKISRIKWYFCKVNSSEEIKKQKTFKYLLKFFNERLDLINYFKILNLIDKIKNIVFNSQQKNSFHLLSKTNIFNDEEFNIYGIKKKINHDLIQKEVVEYYKKRVKKDTMDSYDKKIILMLPDEIKFQIFNDKDF